MYQVKTEVSFEAAHRLYNVNTYSEECRDNIHGHSYKVRVTAGKEELNESGMVQDFKLFKNIVKKEIEDVFDHSCILNALDPLVPAIQKECKKVIVTTENPTAEWMARFFFDTLQKAFNLHGIDLVSVAVEETKNNVATYSV